MKAIMKTSFGAADSAKLNIGKKIKNKTIIFLI